jgi:hypothetical protein
MILSENELLRMFTLLLNTSLSKGQVIVLKYVNLLKLNGKVIWVKFSYTEVHQLE